MKLEIQTFIGYKFKKECRKKALKCIEGFFYGLKAET
nr:MAG TPA: hypothetical protein [Caudoviricetes sp.]